MIRMLFHWYMHFLVCILANPYFIIKHGNNYERANKVIHLELMAWHAKYL